MDAPQNGPMTDALDELAILVFANGNPDEKMKRVAGLASDSIANCDMAGVALLKDEVISTGGSSEELVEEIDSFQYASGSGPCLECMEVRLVVRVGSTSSEERWPSFSSSASRKGIESVLSAPLMLDGRAMGSLNLYSRRTDAFIASDEVDIELFARRAGVVLRSRAALS